MAFMKNPASRAAGRVLNVVSSLLSTLHSIPQIADNLKNFVALAAAIDPAHVAGLAFVLFGGLRQ